MKTPMTKLNFRGKVRLPLRTYKWDIVGHCDANRTRTEHFLTSSRLYNRVDFDKIRGQLQNINWDEVVERDHGYKIL